MQKIHFIGIGGIGISAIARFLKEKNFIISGSDINESQTTASLRNEGISVITPHDAAIITNQDMVVYSAAIKSDNVELVAARKKGIKCLSRKEILPLVLQEKRVFSVAGAHGKSTTSAILASLIEGSVIIGAISKQFGSNMKYFESQNVIFEADESDSSFLNSNPYLAVVTNAEPEHMEHYDYDLAKFYAAYSGFLERSKLRVINAEDEFLSKINMECIKLYPSIDITELKLVLRNYQPYINFTLKNLGKFEVFGIGKHIAIDASLAILAANCEIGLEQIRENLAHYKGIKKRFDILVANKKYALIDDYAHHPTEIEATLKSAREYANMLGISRLIAIWQPHRHTRLKANLEAFKKCFKDADEIVILPVFSCGEQSANIDLRAEFGNLKAKFTDKISRQGEKIAFIDDFSVSHLIDEGIVIGLGAGDISYQLRGER